MSRRWTSVALALSLSCSTAALAQDDTNGAASGGATSGSVGAQPLQPAATDQPGETLTPNAPLQAAPGDGQPAPAGEPLTPNAPVTADQGPVPAGTVAGTTTASGWSPSPTTIAVIGAAAVGAVVCLAVCGGGGTSSTTTTTHK